MIYFIAGALSFQKFTIITINIYILAQSSLAPSQTIKYILNLDL